MNNYTLQEIQYLSMKLISLIKGILNSEEDSLLKTNISKGNLYTDYQTFLKDSVPGCTLFSTGNYFSEYLSYIENTNTYKPDNHYFAYNNRDKGIVISLRNKNKPNKTKYDIIQISTEEEWFQYSTVYSTEILVGMYLWNAFNKENLPSCVIELTEFFKYLKLSGKNFYE